MPAREKETRSVYLEEKWVAVRINDNYEVSSYGRVVNVRTGHELKATPAGHGQLQVQLYRDGKPRSLYVHRLVAEAFFLNFDPSIEVLHKNENYADNGVFNLTLGGPCSKWRE